MPAGPRLLGSVTLRAPLHGLTWLARRLVGRRGYVRFVIVTRARSGSNMLVELLGCHPRVVARGEEFQRLHGRATRDVWNRVFERRVRPVGAVGFKLFHYHPLDSDDRSVWDLVRSDRGMRVIHLRRENLLRTRVSRKIAGRTDAWKQTGGPRPPRAERRVTIDVEKSLAWFERVEGRARASREMLAEHRSLELTFESLVADTQGEMERVFAFLGLPPVRVRTRTRRQNAEPLSELIVNWQEVRDGLAGTPYARFLS